MIVSFDYLCFDFILLLDPFLTKFWGKCGLEGLEF